MKQVFIYFARASSTITKYLFDQTEEKNVEQTDNLQKATFPVHVNSQAKCSQEYSWENVDD